AELDRDDAAAAFRAIVMASPGGLGAAPDQDVRDAPSTTLREAMALAADRDRIARQYRDGAAELFELGLAALAGVEGAAGASATGVPVGVCLASVPESATPTQTAAVQRVYLGWLASAPDSHIVRKHGAALAHSVLSAAVPWAQRAAAGENPDTDPAFAQWDLTLKTAAINPGTSADLTVATLMLAILAAAGHP
ncbi:MAG: triphosphoribosyl-dephospho-CoA synthase, partial [Leptothrix sp. (in: b-proteobacteria)]